MTVLKKNKISDNKGERLESIKNAHSQKSPKFTTRMEDYLEVISELVDLKGYATPTDISNYMHVRPPSVTKMLKRYERVKSSGSETYVLNYYNWNILQLFHTTRFE